MDIIFNNIIIYNNIKYYNIIMSEEYYKKIHDILFEKSGSDKDPYNRQLSKKVVNKFCKIAKRMNISLEDTVSDKQFDIIYKKYVKYQIKKYSM